MATSLHIGKKRTITEEASDGSTIPLGTLTATSSLPGVASVAVDAATNIITVTGVSPGSAQVNVSAPGYQTDSEVFIVAPLPTLVPTIGPEV